MSLKDDLKELVSCVLDIQKLIYDVIDINSICKQAVVNYKSLRVLIFVIPTGNLSLWFTNIQNLPSNILDLAWIIDK